MKARRENFWFTGPAFSVSAMIPYHATTIATTLTYWRVWPRPQNQPR